MLCPARKVSVLGLACINCAAEFETITQAHDPDYWLWFSAGKFVICPTDIVMADSYTRPEALPQGGLPGVSDIINSFNRIW